MTAAPKPGSQCARILADGKPKKGKCVMPAPQIIHELLDRAWDEGTEGTGTGIKIYKTVGVRPYRYAARVGGDASGYSIATPPLDYPELTPQPGPFLISRWQGRFTEEELV